MMGWLRTMRGVLGTGLLWGALGGGVGAVVSLVGAPGDPATLLEWLGSVGVGFAGFGFLAGAGFATTLSLLDGRRSLRELTPGRGAVWGALAGFALPLGLVAALSGGALPLIPAVAVAGVFAAVTAGLGAATVRIATSEVRLDEGRAAPSLPRSTT